MLCLIKLCKKLKCVKMIIKKKLKEIKNVVEKIMIVIYIFFKIFCIIGNVERLWLLEWLIVVVNVVFYLFK